MGKFSITSAATCDLCGKMLSTSDEECDHDGREPMKCIFRRLNEGRDSLVGVKSCGGEHKWQKLYEKVGDDWKAYAYLGPMEDVNSFLNNGVYDSIEDFKPIAWSVHTQFEPDDEG